jgi:hypothetical protein
VVIYVLIYTIHSVYVAHQIMCTYVYTTIYKNFGRIAQALVVHSMFFVSPFSKKLKKYVHLLLTFRMVDVEPFKLKSFLKPKTNSFFKDLKCKNLVF